MNYAYIVRTIVTIVITFIFIVPVESQVVYLNKDKKIQANIPEIITLDDTISVLASSTEKVTITVYSKSSLKKFKEYLSRKEALFDTKGKQKEMGTPCWSATLTEPTTINLKTSPLCDDINDGLIVILKQASKPATVYYLYHKNKILPNVGNDYGISLMLIDRIHDRNSDGDRVGFRSSWAGLNGYYSLGNFWLKSVRAVFNVAYLDFFDKDLEIGLGLGVLFRLGPTDDPNPFTMALGCGYNVMADDYDDGAYWFLGLGLNTVKSSK